MTQSSIPTSPPQRDEKIQGGDAKKAAVNTDEKLLAQVLNTLGEVQTVINGEHVSLGEEKPNQTK